MCIRYALFFIFFFILLVGGIMLINCSYIIIDTCKLDKQLHRFVSLWLDLVDQIWIGGLELKSCVDSSWPLSSFIFALLFPWKDDPGFFLFFIFLMNSVSENLIFSWAIDWVKPSWLVFSPSPWMIFQVLSLALLKTVWVVL